VQPSELERYAGLPEPPLLLDVRTAGEHAGGHVPGSLNVPIQELPDRLAQLEAGRRRGVIVYCESGGRTRAALRLLRDAGFTDVARLAGDMRRWRAERRPVETDRPSR
jgi:rhodanese-related sulfurtransferase